MKLKAYEKNACSQYLWLGVYPAKYPEMWHRQRLGKKASQRTGTVTHLFTLEPELPLLTPLNFSKGRRHWDALATIKCGAPSWTAFPAKHSQRHFGSPMSNQHVVPRGCSPVGCGQGEGHADFPPVHLEGVLAT